MNVDFGTKAAHCREKIAILLTAGVWKSKLKMLRLRYQWTVNKSQAVGKPHLRLNTIFWLVNWNYCLGWSVSWFCSFAWKELGAPHWGHSYEGRIGGSITPRTFLGGQDRREHHTEDIPTRAGQEGAPRWGHSYEGRLVALNSIPQPLMEAL